MNIVAWIGSVVRGLRGSGGASGVSFLLLLLDGRCLILGMCECVSEPKGARGGSWKIAVDRGLGVALAYEYEA